MLAPRFPYKKELNVARMTAHFASEILESFVTLLKNKDEVRHLNHL